jgi:hypothetical protein
LFRSLTILYMLEGTGTLMQRHNRIVRVLRDFLACRLRYIKSANVTIVDPLLTGDLLTVIGYNDSCC